MSFRLSRPAPRTLLLLAFPLAAAAAAAAGAGQSAARLVINGTPAVDPPITVKNKTYISLDALKAAGVTVRVSGGGTTYALTLPGATTGGANQQNGVEGRLGQWLFNGIWRFRVVSVAKADPARDGAGWIANVEIRNGSKFSGYAPGGTGWQGLSLVTEDGTVVGAASDAPELRDPGLAQGAATARAVFFPTESASKPDRLILRFDPKGLVGTPPGLRFTVPDPSFRVDLKNAAAGGG